MPEWRSALPRKWDLIVTSWLWISLAYTVIVLATGIGMPVYPLHFLLMLPAIIMLLVAYWGIGVWLWNYFAPQDHHG
ncbi:MAG: hypothetical protein COA41_14265 [Sphingopyxis sp.]|nr:MAG: hypothetical protein COA41_14265 [Sphingopyxis sp.]